MRHCFARQSVSSRLCASGSYAVPLLLIFILPLPPEPGRSNPNGHHPKNCRIGFQLLRRRMLEVAGGPLLRELGRSGRQQALQLRDVAAHGLQALGEALVPVALACFQVLQKLLAIVSRARLGVVPSLLALAEERLELGDGRGGLGVARLPLCKPIGLAVECLSLLVYVLYLFLFDRLYFVLHRTKSPWTTRSARHPGSLCRPYSPPRRSGTLPRAWRSPSSATNAATTRACLSTPSDWT